MSPSTKTLRRRVRKAVVYATLASFLASMSQPALAALTTLASSPLSSTTSVQVKPNIMYLMDTSGSMAWSHMPDSMESYITRVGYKSSQCNSIYYNPNITYTPAKKADGTNYASPPFTAAYYDPYLSPGTTTNLSTSFRAYDSATLSSSSSDTAQQAYYYLYKDTSTPAQTPVLVWNSSQCTQSPSGTPDTAFAATGGGTWQRIKVSATSGPGGTDETQNFANWYSYYRTRILMMKSAASRSFNALNSGYRVGLITISPGSPVASSDYLAIGDFDTTQRTNWYAKLFAQTTASSTPLREALARVGRHYAGVTTGINSGMTPDPVQYSCQQNFTILTTDGYWNGNGPIKIDGTAVGQQDGDLSVTPRPMWDGGTTGSSVVTDKGNLYQYATCTASVASVQVTTTQLYYFSQQVTETHTQSYYFAQQAQRCSNTSIPCTGSFSNTSSSSNRYSGSGGSPRTPDDGYLYYTCSGRQCRVLATPAFTSPYTGWTSGACPSDSGGINYACQTTAPTAPAPVTGSCPSNSGGRTYTCSATPGSVPGFPAAPTDPTTVGYQTASTTSCPSAPAGYTYTCGTSSTKQTTVTTLPGGSACPAAGPGQTVSCTNITTGPGQKIQYQTTTYTTTSSTSGGIAIGTPTTTTGTGSWTDLTGTCYANGAGTLPALPNPNPQRPVPVGTPPAPTGGCSAWPCTTTTTSSSGGSSNTLADTAQYYYNTDLRPTMTDNVPSTGQGVEDDKAPWQHMTTFTMGLGVSGNLTYRSDYKTATTGDFAGLRAGTIGWPAPAADSPTAIDDLWHAAVNGRGQYFSAGDPETVVSGLQTALAGINARVASAAAAATSNLEPVAGDNFAYTAKYQTVKWTGELEAHQIDLSTGAVLPTVIWSAQSQLDGMTHAACDTRNIYLYRAGATNNRVNFTWNTDTCDSSGAPSGVLDTGLNGTEQGYFGSAQVALLGHYPLMTDGTGTPATVNQRAAAVGAPLVNYVRGQKGKEGFVPNDLNLLYRARDHVLGDIVNAQPVYVKAPFASYTDAGYTAYKSAQASREQMVYAAANDGMLHGFDAITGQESWAYIPSIVLPNLYKLADNNWGNLDVHQYSVDGTPSVGDAYSSGTGWRTILVAGLNGGGKGYYAIDVTDPTTPKGLWEFKWSSTCNAPTTLLPMATVATSDCHVGYTYNNPIITKLNNASHQWVVIVTSGYNNVNSPAAAGDGLGYLYVLDAFTGQIIYKIPTSAGSSGTPSGLNHINNWVDNTLVDNTTLRVYGIDLLGNIWRFDVNNSILPLGFEATLIGQAKDSSGNPQPISTRPELAEVNGSPMVFAATGQFLGAGDITNTQQQSIYGVIDPLTATTGYADLRAAVKPMQMTQVGTGSAATRTIDCVGTNAECNSPNGWVADLPDSGERVNVDMKLQLGTLVVASNVPQNSACTVGGYSWLNYLNYATGTAVANSAGGAVSQMLSDSLAVGLNIVRLPSGETVVITTTSDAKQTTIGAPFDVPSPTGKRISWREISQ